MHQYFASLEYKINVWKLISSKLFFPNFLQFSITGIRKKKKIGIHSVLTSQKDFSHSLQFLYTFVNETLWTLFPK